MFDDLLPLSTEAPRCNDFARSIDLRPPGTGLFLDRVILVEVPLPWPKPALKHPTLEASARLVAGNSIRSRLFAAESFGPDSGQGLIQVEVYEREETTAVLHRWTVEDLTALERLIAALVSSDLGTLGEIATSGAQATEPERAGATFLVCVQGGHDMCCGVSGTALADELARDRPDYTIRRVSHTGGHRFAPTLLAFPEGRMWAYADLALVDRIANQSTTASDHRTHARGWWGAKVGPAQVAESAVRAELAHEPFVAPHISLIESPDNSSQYRVTAGENVFIVDVSVGRQVPSISCEAPGGLPAKPGREFAWTIERSVK